MEQTDPDPIYVRGEPFYVLCSKVGRPLGVPVTERRRPDDYIHKVKTSRGMGDQESWNASDFLKNVKVDITLAQFVRYALKTRAAFTESVQLQENLRRRTTRFSEEIQEMNASKND